MGNGATSGNKRPKHAIKISFKQYRFGILEREIIDLKDHIKTLKELSR
jgi:hypothetical protein